MSDLVEAITDAIESQTDRASDLGNEGRIQDCAAIIDEWTIGESHTCILTKFLTEELSTVSDFLIYATISEDELIHGSFSFDPEAELPADHN